MYIQFYSYSLQPILTWKNFGNNSGTYMPEVTSVLYVTYKFDAGFPPKGQAYMLKICE